MPMWSWTGLRPGCTGPMCTSAGCIGTKGQKGLPVTKRERLGRACDSHLGLETLEHNPAACVQQYPPERGDAEIRPNVTVGAFDRANAARTLMQGTGMASAQVRQIRGPADQQLRKRGSARKTLAQESR